MRSWMIAFSLGVVLALWLPRLPSVLLCALLLVLCGLLCCYRPVRSRPGWFAVSGFFMGVLWLCYTGAQRLEQWWPEQTAAQDIWVEGIIWSLPLKTARSTRFRLRLDRYCPSAELAACTPGQWLADRRIFMISVYEPLALVPGQRWRMQLRVRRPHGQANPGGFDYEAWLLQQHISATGYVRSSQNNQLLAANTYRRLAEQVRYYLLRQLDQMPAQFAQLPLIKALAIGEGSEIPDAQWALFRETGTMHLMVISGSHISLIAGLVLVMARQVLCRFHKLILWQPASVVASAIALISAWAYTALAGFNLPALRALLMTAIVLSAGMLQRHSQSWNVLTVALTCMLVFDPLAPLSAGFWLSFIAVAILQLGFVAPGLEQDTIGKRFVAGCKQLVLTQLRISVVLIPLTALLFRQVSFSAPLINLLAIPLIGFIGVPLSLGGVLLAAFAPALALPVLQLADGFLQIYLTGLQALANLAVLPSASLPALSNAGWLLLIAVTCGYVFSRTMRGRIVSVAFLPLLFWCRQLALPGDTLRVIFLDAGQGTSVLLSTADHHLVYDAGPGEAQAYNAGDAIVLPAMQALGIRQVDRVIISHADSDHAGGLAAIIDAFPNTRLSAPPGLLENSAVTQQACTSGDSWQWNGVQFAILHPDAGAWDRNNGSCVLLVSLGSHRLLLTGDIERKAEQSLLARTALAPASMLLAPHHGSQTSSSPAFINVVQPAHVVYTTGYQNRYSHPAKAVQERYAKAGSRPWNTAYTGAVYGLFDAANPEVHISTFRDTHRRFWR